MVATCHYYALNKFRHIINRDYDNTIGNKDDYIKENDILYIISDLNIFSEIYNHCIKKVSTKSIIIYFGNISNIDYSNIKLFLDKWSKEVMYNYTSNVNELNISV